MPTDHGLAPWLALRESIDHRSRSSALTGLLAAHLPADRPLRILDLGTGRGSNIRYLAPRLPQPQEWLVVDRDPALLAAVASRASAGARVHVATRCENLAPLAADLFDGRHLVTASALLDLVSEQWLRLLANRCRAQGAAALFALTYNGESSCAPSEPEDNTIRRLLNQHQKTDKGFGPAAGPDANAAAERAFRDAGYEVRSVPTEWRLGPESSALQRELVEGWARPALELAPEQAPMIRDWLSRRLDHLSAGRSHIVVGHYDLAAWPS
jgi:SAM-dependent methyltransferase